MTALAQLEHGGACDHRDDLVLSRSTRALCASSTTACSSHATITR
jgi:hypothetical protein